MTARDERLEAVAKRLHEQWAKDGDAGSLRSATSIVRDTITIYDAIRAFDDQQAAIPCACIHTAQCNGGGPGNRCRIDDALPGGEIPALSSGGASGRGRRAADALDLAPVGESPAPCSPEDIERAIFDELLRQEPDGVRRCFNPIYVEIDEPIELAMVAKAAMRAIDIAAIIRKEPEMTPAFNFEARERARLRNRDAMAPAVSPVGADPPWLDEAAKIASDCYFGSAHCEGWPEVVRAVLAFAREKGWRNA